MKLAYCAWKLGFLKSSHNFFTKCAILTIHQFLGTQNFMLYGIDLLAYKEKFQ